MADLLVRRDIWSLEEDGPWHPITKAFAGAIAVMKQRQASDPTSLAAQAAIHSSTTGDWREQCQHRSWYFLPWHRLYLYWFEQIVRAAVCDLPGIDPEVARTWALPYWNYSRGARYAAIPAAFREPELPEGGENPLYLPERNGYINHGDPVPAEATDTSVALGPPFFSLPAPTGGFGGGVTGLNHFSEDPNARGGALEQTPHNDVHVAVGGYMADFDTAGLDPVFWMHHANIDRLWSVWLSQPGRDNPDDGRWSNERFRFPDPHGTPQEKPVSDVVDTESVLGYKYDETAAPMAGAPGRGTPMTADQPPAQPPEHPPELVGASEERIHLAGDEASVAVPVGEPEGPARRGISGDAPESRILLSVEGVQGERAPEIPYGVYLDLPGAGERRHVGNVSFFGIEKAGDVGADDSHALDYTFDVTDAVAELRSAGHWDPAAVKVTFAPLRPVERRGITGEAARPPVSIGRVGFYVH